ncbi:MAG: hypothetical protein GXP41_10955 [Chloroflexi bacterium]|nr:hypothetical protein [Chloroflexota bacterium]
MGGQLVAAQPVISSGSPANNARSTDRAHVQTEHLAGEATFDAALQQAARSSSRLSSAASQHWQTLHFLKTSRVPRVQVQAGVDSFARLRSWLRTLPVQREQNASPNASIEPAPAVVAQNGPLVAQPPVTTGTTPAISAVPGVDGVQGATSNPMPLDAYPHPPADNGRGMHWIPTLGSPPAVVDHFVKEMKDMHIKWGVFLNDGTNVGANDYLAQKLTQAGIEPVLRVYTPGLVPIGGDLQAMVRHYKSLGVRYFQLYNEPNLRVETGGNPPDVQRYLDLWLPAAEAVTKAGGLPGFGALSPQGEYDDRKFLRNALRGIKARGKVGVLDHAWLAIHNYTGPRALDDPNGFLRFEQYDRIVRDELGRSLPVIGTEGGTHVSNLVSEKEQTQMVTGAYDYMRHRQPYNFAYTYWLIANEAGGGKDAEFGHYALFRPDGTSPLVDALRRMA